MGIYRIRTTLRAIGPKLVYRLKKNIFVFIETVQKWPFNACSWIVLILKQRWLYTEIPDITIDFLVHTLGKLLNIFFTETFQIEVTSRKTGASVTTRPRSRTAAWTSPTWPGRRSCPPTWPSSWTCRGKPESKEW